jgi:hypothetical protein
MKRLLTFVAATWAITSLTAQVPQGGAPWQWGVANVEFNVPVVSTSDLDLLALAAEDAVTDQYKEAPWRFGVERLADFGLANSGLWEHSKDRWIWRLGVHCPGATGIGLTLDRKDTVSWKFHPSQ